MPKTILRCTVQKWGYKILASPTPNAVTLLKPSLHPPSHRQLYTMDSGTIPSSSSSGTPNEKRTTLASRPVRRWETPAVSSRKKGATITKRPSTRTRRKEAVLTGRMTYRWSFIQKPKRSKLGATAITGVRSALGWFKPDAPGMYVLALHVKGHGATYKDEIQVRVLGKDDEENSESVMEDGTFIWKGPKQKDDSCPSQSAEISAETGEGNLSGKC